MITVVITYRNRDIHIVKNCLDSFQMQTSQQFQIVLTNYGSEDHYNDALNKLLQSYPKVHYHYFPTQGMLWNKAKQINFAVQHYPATYVLVADVDMMFHPEFIQKCNAYLQQHSVVYFKVGYLGKGVAEQALAFEQYPIQNFSNHEATGITILPQELFTRIGGMEEFFHGWGSEDTELHYRLQNNGFSPFFVDKEVLVLHQWHPKNYRSKKTRDLFHGSLEQINWQYANQVKQSNKKKGNLYHSIGILPTEVNKADAITIQLSNRAMEVDALLKGSLDWLQQPYEIIIHQHPDGDWTKMMLKKVLGKKVYPTYAMPKVKELLIELVIQHHFGLYYQLQCTNTYCKLVTIPIIKRSEA